MKFFGKFKTYFINEKVQQCSPLKKAANNWRIEDFKKEESEQKEKRYLKSNNFNQQSFRKKSTDSFQLIVQDIINEPSAMIAEPITEENQIMEPSSQTFQNLVYQEEEPQEQHEQIQNMYVTGIVFINKYSQGRQLTIQEWDEMVKNHNLSLQSQKNIYFSILKGIHFSVRKKVWQLLANTHEMKKLTKLKYQQLADQKQISQSNVSIIDKDVPRSVNITRYTKQLRKILIAYVNFSKRDYTQGMNLIAGSLLQLLAYQNDEALNQFDIFQKDFEQRVFWIFVGVMKWKNWEHVFQKDLSGLKQMLVTLQGLMVQYVPSVYQKLIDYDWDLTIFSQYYITILLYNTNKQFSKVILDLFLLDGQNVIHSLVIRMLKLNEDKIRGIMDEGQLMEYFKKKMIAETFEGILRDKINAKKLQDFEINFIQSNNI